MVRRSRHVEKMLARRSMTGWEQADELGHDADLAEWAESKDRDWERQVVRAAMVLLGLLPLLVASGGPGAATVGLCVLGAVVLIAWGIGL